MKSDVLVRDVVAVVSLAALSVFAEATPSIDGSVMTFDISGTDTYSAVIPSTCTKVIKKGSGTLTMSGNSADFHGNVEIQKGVVVATHMNALGRSSGGAISSGLNTISVWKDAQLRATFATDKSDGNTEGRGFRSIIEIAGDGPDGTGAFYYDRASNASVPYWLIAELKLTADASIGGTIAYSARTFNLNYKTLTVKTPAYLYFYYNNVTKPGHIVAQNHARIWGSTFNGGTTNLLTLSSATPTFYLSTANPINWSVLLDCTGKGTIENNSGGADGTKNVINGDFTFNGTQLLVWPQANCGVTFGGNLVSHSGYLDKGGTGALFIRGDYNTATRWNVSGGDLIVTGSKTNIMGTLGITATASASFDNAGLVLITNNSMLVLGRLEKGELPAKLEIMGNTELRSIASGTYLYVGTRQQYSSNYERTWGTLTVGEGASVSNNLAVGYSGRGAVYQKGGDVYWAVPEAKYGGQLGSGMYCGYGYYSMDAGALTIPRYTTFAGDHPDATAFFVQRGGTASVLGENLKLSSRGHANLYLSGSASFTQTAGSTYMGFTDGTLGTGGDATLTVDGTGSVFKAAWFVGMQNRQDFTSYININTGGVFETTYIVNNAGTGWTWPSGSKQYVSFNGGTWRTPHNIGLHNAFYSADRAAPDAFLCQKGGAVFDTDNSSVNLNAPLVAPTGKTIKSITLPADADFVASTNIGPARISITGSGVGATAFAPFDDDAGRLRGDVIITSPGTGYGNDTVVKVCSPDGDRSWDCTYELEDAVSGGLTKCGTGKLSLQCVNTFRGKTCIKGGMVEMAVAGGIPDGNALEIAAGTTLALSNNLSVSTLEGAGRTLGGTDKSLTVTDALMLDPDNLAAGKSLSIEGWLVFAAGAKISAQDVELSEQTCNGKTFVSAAYIAGEPTIDVSLGSRWRIVRNASGTALTLRYIRGTAFLIR